VLWLSVPPLNSIAKKRADVRRAAEGPLRACFVFRADRPPHGARIAAVWHPGGRRRLSPAMQESLSPPTEAGGRTSGDRGAAAFLLPELPPPLCPRLVISAPGRG
jgi:hypothetical protein